MSETSVHKKIGRILPDVLEASQCLLEYIFVKHLFFSKLVYRLKACNFVRKGIAKKSYIKLSKILEGAIL